MRYERLAMVIISIGLIVCFPYLFWSGYTEGEAAVTSAKAMVSIIAFNSSQQVLFDYAGTMDLAGIEALADANPTNPIPGPDLTGKLPAPLDGWSWLIFGDQYVGNSTDSTAIGMYTKGSMFSMEALAYVTIFHSVDGFDFEWDPGAIEGIIGFDDGYPKEITVQGYPGIEWRSSGENLGEVTEFQGYLETLGALWVGLGTSTPIPETALVSLGTLALLGGLSMRRKS